MKKVIFIIVLAGWFQNACGQKNDSLFTRVEPPFWWAGMKSHELQLMFYQKHSDLQEYSVSSSTRGVEVKSIEKTDNPHYLFVKIGIGITVKPGEVQLKFVNTKKTFVFKYQLKEKSTDKKRIQGINTSDVVYLIMPDRFSNGDPSNDSITGFPDGLHRDKPFGRHGGDFRGLENHLDYLNDLGVTALWLNPVIENNQRQSSYHGYAFTDFYCVDRRFGSNEEYLKLIDNMHGKGLKIIQDMVANHMGSQHWMMADLPDKNWIHQFPQYKNSTFRATVISDPHKSKQDVQDMEQGWFSRSMADINQSYPLVETYLTQNSLWWIEYAGLDGIRMDTWPYNDKEFLSRYAKALTDEYPSFWMVGEVWMNTPANTSYWAKGRPNFDGYTSWLPSVTDFPLCFAVPKALSERGGSETGLSKIYNVLSQDFDYPSPSTNMIFLDNHDLSRWYLLADNNVDKYKMGLSFLMTTRGVPQIYYGVEILMDGDIVSHPNVRKDFPGGWKGDAIDAFTKEGRTTAQNDAFDYLKQLLNWRKAHASALAGKLTQYVPQDNVYVYFRYSEKSDRETIMVIMNGNSEHKTIDGSRFAENIKGFTKATDAMTGEKLQQLNSITVPGITTRILLLNQ